MTGWAATNTLRELVNAEWRRWDDAYGPEDGVDPPRQYDAALALVETALDEAERCVKLHTYGSNGQVDPLHRDLAAALRAVREGAS